jgi:hypothetical protein
MEFSNHTLKDLFGQLGLPDSFEEIEGFISRHRPLAAGVQLADAPFWTSSQAGFLRDEIDEDADWAELVDQLNLRLRE